MIVMSIFSLSIVQYISLMFIGMLIVISVRGFLTNLMKVTPDFCKVEFNIGWNLDCFLLLSI